MSDCKLDHLVVAAADLDTGREYIEDLLGVKTVQGGRHETMGTHNRLLRLGDEQYLEIIAIDPEAPPPDHPRWFALDDRAMQSLIQRGPRLVTWVAQTRNIDKASAGPPYKGLEIRDMARGDLRWRMTFTREGELLGEGTLPLLIEWQTGQTPPRRLADSGCILKRLVVRSPRVQEIRQTLRGLNLENAEVDEAGQSGLDVTLHTPGQGDVILHSAAKSESNI
ncbi:MAG: hypothetical protein MAG794_01490 [Gammaproteobacteria bacterium]|nr:hypothetical protein [Gammaproteobacteria bacterium]